jgi:predicted nucleotidyltransferase
MRLSDHYRNTIKQTAHEVWGNQVSVILFGSRIDDSKKGGDIDLLLQVNDDENVRDIVRKKIKFLSRLDILLGEQKIDLIVATKENQRQNIVQTALQTGIRL